MEHQPGIFAPLREFIRKIVIQQGTCGYFQPKTYYPTRFPLSAGRLPERQKTLAYLRK
jgi:hypothetical protein